MTDIGSRDRLGRIWHGLRY